MNNQEFKTLRKSCFKTAKEASKYFNTPYETWKSWESGKRRVPGIAVGALYVHIELKKFNKTLDAMIVLQKKIDEINDLKKGGKTYNKINNKGG